MTVFLSSSSHHLLPVPGGPDRFVRDAHGRQKVVSVTFESDHCDVVVIAGCRVVLWVDEYVDWLKREKKMASGRKIMKGL